MTKIRLAYVHEFRDRHGKVRRYVRVPGAKRIPLKGAPGTDEFMEAYRAALTGEAPYAEIGSTRTRPGSVNAATVGYYRSVQYLNLAPSTQRVWRNILERFRTAHGDKPINKLERRHIADMVAAKANTPAAAKNFLKVLRSLLQYAQSAGMLTGDDPTAGVKSVKIRSEGIYTWSDADIAAFEAKHPIGSRARLSLALLLYTAQRRSDVIRMGRQHVRDGTIHVTQQKTGAVLAIPLHHDLATIIEATPNDHLTFLVTKDGSPFSGAGFGNLFREWCNDAGLPHCSAHGLRKAACRRLAEAGCSAPEIMSISGHKSLREVQRYCAAADQARMARAAMATVTSAFTAAETRTSIGKPE